MTIYKYEFEYASANLCMGGSQYVCRLGYVLFNQLKQWKETVLDSLSIMSPL